MKATENSCAEAESQPYKPLREHPQYGELKRIIEQLPPEKLQKLKKYIEGWLAERETP